MYLGKKRKQLSSGALAKDSVKVNDLDKITYTFCKQTNVMVMHHYKYINS